MAQLISPVVIESNTIFMCVRNIQREGQRDQMLVWFHDYFIKIRDG
jgi:hypothetical protein